MPTRAPSRRARVRTGPLLRVVAALTVVASSAACGGGAEERVAVTPSRQPTTMVDECRTFQYRGEQLGVTVPAGSTVGSDVSGIDKHTYQILAVLDAPAPAPGADAPPDVRAVVVGAQPIEDPRHALDVAVLNLNESIGVYDQPDRLPVRATTVGGVPALAGSDEGPPPAPGEKGFAVVRWWQLVVDDVWFGIAVGARDEALDAAFTERFVQGLRAGGCAE